MDIPIKKLEWIGKYDSAEDLIAFRERKSII
jgi:hypothetical protein